MAICIKSALFSLLVLVSTVSLASYPQSLNEAFSSVTVVNEHTKSCAASATPVAYRTLDGGITWEPRKFGAGIIRAISCERDSGQTCIAVGDIYGSSSTTLLAYTSSDGGTSWAGGSIASHGSISGLNGISCKGTNCVAVGAYSKSSAATSEPIAYTSTVGTGKWVPHYPPVSGTLGSALRVVSCSGNNGELCTAIGDYNSGYDVNRNTTTFVSYMSTNGGVTWNSRTIAKQNGESRINSITCDAATGQKCVAVGTLAAILPSDPAQPIIYRTTNAGSSWAAYLPKQGIGGGLNSVTCNGENAEYCVAVGYYIKSGSNKFVTTYTSSNGGSTWSLEPAHSMGSYDAVTCSKNGQQCITISTYSAGGSCGSPTTAKRTPYVYTNTNYGVGGWNQSYANGFGQPWDGTNTWYVEKEISISSSIQ